MNIEERIAIAVGKLKEIVGGTVKSEFGLCNACDLPLVMVDQFVYWPEYENHNAPCFPIEGDSATYFCNKRKYDRRTKFGKKRIALAKWLIERFDT